MMNAELRQLFQDDQAERQGELSSRPPAYWEAVGHQKYGTQYKADGRRYQLLEVDPTTTDVERLEWGVPILAEAARGAEELTRQYFGSSAGRE